MHDLIDMVVDSQIISKLFTQGRHRNANVIIFLQNAFPNGKFNTSIICKTQFIALLRCPADRREIGIMADRILEFLKITSKFLPNLIPTCWQTTKPISR